MTWIAQFHPEFAEELALLSADLRIQFYAQLMRQQSQGPLSQNLPYHFPAAAGKALGMHTRIQRLGFNPEFHASFDTRVFNDHFLYIHLAGKGDDTAFVDATRARLSALIQETVEPLAFDEFFESIDQAERCAALDINADRSSRALDRLYVDEAFLEAKEEAATIFNFGAPQMERMLARYDFFLRVFNEKLRKRGGDLTLAIAMKGAEPQYVKSFRTLKEKADFYGLSGR